MFCMTRLVCVIASQCKTFTQSHPCEFPNKQNHNIPARSQAKLEMLQLAAVVVMCANKCP